MKKLATLALVLTLGVAAVATTGCSSESTATKSTTKGAATGATHK